MSGSVVSLDEACELRKKAASQGKKVVFTNGCFDLLHVGHIRYLKEARQQGDLLIVGVNDDQSTRRLKGRGRPYMGQEDRAEILASLNCVDLVVVFSEQTAERLVESLRPDVYVKGGDYTVEELPEAKIVTEYGGEVYLARLVPNCSTTDLASAVVKWHRGEAE
jgi:D-beta-D-heptose 7-phosphate kinase/D-beta-D-heptose 1-phosphate adenosyltransferase